MSLRNFTTYTMWYTVASETTTALSQQTTDVYKFELRRTLFYLHIYKYMYVIRYAKVPSLLARTLARVLSPLTCALAKLPSPLARMLPRVLSPPTRMLARVPLPPARTLARVPSPPTHMLARVPSPPARTLARVPSPRTLARRMRQSMVEPPVRILSEQGFYQRRESVTCWPTVHVHANHFSFYRLLRKQYIETSWRWKHSELMTYKFLYWTSMHSLFIRWTL